MSRTGSRRARRRDGHGHDERVAPVAWRLGEGAVARGQEQGRRGEAAALERALPDPVAARAVGGRRRVEADRPGDGPEEGGGHRRVDHDPGRLAGEGPAGGGASGPGPDEVGQGEGPNVGLGRGRRDRDGGPGPAQGADELLIGGAQADGRAE